MPAFCAGTVAGLVGAGNACASTLPDDAGREAIEPVVSADASERLLEKELKSKLRPEFEQPAAKTAMNENAATRNATREQDDTIERGMWLLTHTQLT